MTDIQREKGRKTISKELRRIIITAYENMKSSQEIADLSGTSRSSVDRIVKTYCSEGKLEAKVRGGQRSHTLTDEQKTAVRGWILEDCSITLKKIKEELESKLGVVTSIATIHRLVEGFNFTLKRTTRFLERRNDENTVEIRYNYALQFLSFSERKSNECFYFLDEVGFNCSMRASRGRALKGQRAVRVVQNLRTRNISLCCTMNKNGTFYYEKQSFPFNRESFLLYMERVMDKLHEKGEKRVVFVMDNVPFHKVTEITNIVEKRGYEILYLPPYSPFLNPIENMFSQWKTLVRSGNSRSEEELLANIDAVFAKITSENCENYYQRMLGFINRCLSREQIEDGWINHVFLYFFTFSCIFFFDFLNVSIFKSYSRINEKFFILNEKLTISNEKPCI
jgi:transposase